MKKKLLIIMTALPLLMLLSAGCGSSPQREGAEYYDSENNKKAYRLENECLSFELDGETGDFVLTDRRSGATWQSSPEGAESDPLADATMKKWMRSSVILTCSSSDGIQATYDSYSLSTAQGSFAVREEDGAVAVDYLIGEKTRSWTLPEVISEERYNGFVSQMEKQQASTVKSLYKKTDIDKVKTEEEREELTARYPLLLESPVIYTLRSGAAEYKYEQAQEAFAALGYTLQDYAADRVSEDEEASAARFNVTLIYSLDGDALRVRVPAESIRSPEGLPIVSLQLLPYFVSGGAQDEGYLMIPDGGGAQIDFGERRGSSEAAICKIYGWDAALSKDKMISENKAAFPVFAAVRNGSSLMAVAESCGCEMSLEANVSGARNSINSVTPSFEVVHGDQVQISGKSAATVTIFETEPPKTDIELIYFAGQSDSYADMALRYRRYLTDRYPDMKERTQEGYPLTVELIGAVDHVTQVAGIPMSRELVCTDAAEAQAIVSSLTEAGVRRLNVKYTAILSGGIRQRSIQSPSLITDAADGEELSALAGQLRDSGGALYLGAYAQRVMDTGLFDGFSKSSDAIRDTLSDIVEAAPYNKVTYRQRTGRLYYILNKEACREALQGYAGFLKDLGLDGAAFEDLGSEIASDFNKRSHTSRSEMAAAQQEELAKMRAGGLGVMVNYGNAYAAPYADTILDMDLSGSGYNLTGRQIPFYQIALHGLVNYTGEALDLSADREQLILRSVECGAGLYAVFAQIDPQELQMTDYTEYSSAGFDRWQEELTDLYRDINGAMGHTAAQKITGHRYITDTLTLTVYEDGTRVYVNYGYGDAVCDGVSIAARDYTVIR